MGYPPKNPHLPDGWVCGNSLGRGGSKALEIQAGEGVVKPEKTSSGIISIEDNLEHLGM